MNGVASYKAPAVLETDKKVNLVYGLNGTGKSILSNYLYEKENGDFSKCNIENLNNEDILVYNQKFIQDYFYESDNLKGIFTLSKENKEAEKKIKNAEKEIEKLEIDKKSETYSITTHTGDLSQKKKHAENKTWEIKDRFAGGDRVLEYCLSGLMGRKESLFNHLSGITKPAHQSTKSTDQLKKEVEAIQSSTAQKYDLLPKINFTAQKVEKKQLFQKNIIGNKNSTVASLINKLKNSDWVKEGLKYLPREIEDSGEFCPFCQEKTVTITLLKNIQEFFDETYENDINELKNLLSLYENDISLLPQKETFDSIPFIDEEKNKFENLYNAVTQLLSKNKTKIREKHKTPGQEISLSDSTNAINDFNQFIEKVNKSISDHNSKIDNKDDSLDNIKKQFWAIVRWDYDQPLSAYKTDKTDIEQKIKKLKNDIKQIEGSIAIQSQIVSEQQKKTVNIEKPITFINNGLTELGLEDFHIEKHSESLYIIVRDNQDSDTFQTLSEGERMIISFLYFIELCRGKKSAGDVGGKKIIVIDDPISSLSHIFIFNIGQLIKKEFLFSDTYEQVFLLTHSLYFFYELTDPNHNRRKENQKLFRITKNCDGSQIFNMKYEEIQNDYHSYWQIIKDDKQPPALIANCMRNIIEYFFNFIEKKDLNNVFQKPELQENKHQAFCRYINRESHSLGQNIFDYKEFNYNDFKEALGLVFQESGYKEHYEEMIK
jgi:wobble nucleotide-excising tRNase